MRLTVRFHEAEPWRIDPTAQGDMEESADGVSLEAAFYEAAQQVAEDAGSDLLESPFQWDRDQLRLDVFHGMRRSLQEPGDTYRAPDGTVYALEEDPSEEQAA